MEHSRYLVNDILEDITDKMVFIGGARQVGKTTLAKKIISKNFSKSFYYNWDYAPDRKKLLSLELPGENGLLIFDEIHKYGKWKSLIKGIFDKYNEKYNLIVTGSARMNIYRRGGDSMQGRYFYYTLFPFSLAELNLLDNKINPMGELQFHDNYFQDSVDVLFRYGGFPEPLFKESEKFLRRWHTLKLERLFREDIRDVENIRDFTSMTLLGDMIPAKVSSPLSINSIREDLNVSHRAVTSWLSILEQFYYHFRIFPFNSSRIRSLKKEPKLYLYDWSEVEKEGPRFENMIAVHLLKLVSYLKEAEGFDVNLHFLKNVDKKEVDFLVTVKNKPWFAVEVKLNDTAVSPNSLYFKQRLNIPFVYQVINKDGVDVLKNDVRVISAGKFLSALV
jgi:predicted AAA+ superfamily ATPase